MRRLILFTFVAVTSCFLFCPYILAQEKEKAGLDCSSKSCFPLITDIGPYKVSLLGSKLFRYYFWTAYSIALYGPKEARSIELILADVPKKLTLVYRLDFTAKEIIDAADKLLKDNPDVNYKKIELQLQEINKLYLPVKSGESYSLEYLPGKGTTLLLNDKPLGTVSGAEFARDYFGIWLSKYPISESMRDDLLGID